ncbi:F-box protein At3g07870-like [Salvia miltiorrhiza]|uniref:F-box protein At3g07870-like n=1 Tax=Salvia miltiorrhiza TaxID=226208 RepID=UPI0025ABAEEC|nr:F-box protein At3g07870-like [Salvia miltiorrhiza]
MERDFFRYLPQEIIIDILSRLPIITILSCKCVCKSWNDLVKSSEFAESHLSRSVPGLALFLGRGCRKPHKILEFVDMPGLVNSEHHRNRVFNVNFKFNFPSYAYIYSSVNGLLFMCTQDMSNPRDLFICNPVTHDYISLPHPPDCLFLHHSFGFGMSKTTGQYKLVRIFHVCREFVPPECEVYTLGTGLWRSIKAGGPGPLMYEARTGAFMNGNLHWLVADSKGCQRISCFDLETELFSSFASPPDRPKENNFFRCCLSVLGDRLCLCDNFNGVIVIWMMKEYGDEKSWTKEFVIRKQPHRSFWGKFCGFHFPIKVFKDGDILVAEQDGPDLFCYSSEGGTIQEIDPFKVCCYSLTNTVIYTPSFLSVKMFGTEKVCSF